MFIKFEKVEKNGKISCKFEKKFVHLKFIDLKNKVHTFRKKCGKRESESEKINHRKPGKKTTKDF